ncbi:MAG: CDP-alcohol phosphatidyltransferase family protein, partial [Gammaproteobacteria bacterium]|nr:CDP-alcohol phosphatidyltransferase family protein [Gammaproteobacteria bacterium]
DRARRRRAVKRYSALRHKYCSPILCFRATHHRRRHLDKQKARFIADALTWCRIVSAVPITVLAWYEMRWWVFGLYIAASLTDFFDGLFARRAIPATTDIDFDGIADLVFSVMTLLWLWMLVPGFFEAYWLPYMPLLVALEMYMISLRARFVHRCVPHLRFGRFAMALFMCLLPVLLLWGDVSWFVHLVFIVGTAGKMQLAWAMRLQRDAKNVS